ncbi:MAG: prefoldin subunit alpha [Candidatus Altiarchaeales archaeon]|nr:prefoldin subunit alpha [Candidatus Altiarchaeales archaeon]
MTEKPDEQLQETLMRIEGGKKQLEALIQQSRVIEAAMVELNSAVEVLEQVKKKKIGDEILVPIGGESFIKVSLKDNENVIAGIGAKVSVEKNIDDAVKTLKDRAEEIGKTLVKVRENAVSINSQMEELSRSAQEMLENARAKK